MRPNFALSLSFEGISLLLRSADGWYFVDEVDLESPSLAGDLVKLEGKASELSHGFITTKLIIPNDQIKYIKLETGELDEDELDRLVLDALDGATPYAVSDLAYDVISDRTYTYIAAVVNATLDEAESFAREHNFNPVSCVAIPEEGNFIGEPFFGPTSLNGNLTISRDQDVVVVVGNVTDIPHAIPTELQDPETKSAYTTIAETQTGAAKDGLGIGDRDISVSTVERAIDKKAMDAEHTADPLGDTHGKQAVAPHFSIETIEQEPTLAATDFAHPPISGGQEEISENPVVVGFDSQPGHIRSSPSLTGTTRDTQTISVISASVPPIDDAPSKTPEMVRIDTPEPQLLSRRTSGTEAIPAPAPISTQAATEEQRLTIFGARRPDRKAVFDGKSKFVGLTLTALLLLFLAGIAAWSAVFMDQGLARFFNPPNEDVIAEAPASLAHVTSEDVGPNVETMSLLTELNSEETAVLGARSATHVDTAIVLPEVSAQELADNYAVTGIWPVSPRVEQPTSLIRLDDLYIASIDPTSSSNDAIALPDVGLLMIDRVLGEQTTPLAAGTLFALGANGLVIPTINGAITPDGVTVFLGRPTVTPPKMPERKTSPESMDPALASASKTRPQSRPSNLIELNERSVNGGLTRSELAQSRPKLRPAFEQAISQKEVDLAVESAQNDKVTTAVITGSQNPQAVTISVRPDGRPKSFEKIVKRARTNQSTDQGTRVASVEPTTVVPKISSSANAIISATIKNAINLRNVNLIGVYGEPSSRKALVRLSNGSYQKIQVGDTIDGGRVSAIGDNELRYTKGSRNLVLKMPKG